MLPKQARGTFRKHITKLSEQVNALLKRQPIGAKHLERVPNFKHPTRKLLSPCPSPTIGFYRGVHQLHTLTGKWHPTARARWLVVTLRSFFWENRAENFGRWNPTEFAMITILLLSKLLSSVRNVRRELPSCTGTIWNATNGPTARTAVVLEMYRSLAFCFTVLIGYYDYLGTRSKIVTGR